MKFKTPLHIPALLLATANLLFGQALVPKTTLWSNTLESNTVGQSTGASPAVINGFRFNFPGGTVRDSSTVAPFGPENKYLELSPNNTTALVSGYRVLVNAVLRAQYVATPVGVSFDFNESTAPGFGTIIGFGTGTSDSAPDVNATGGLVALQFRNGVITLGSNTSIVDGTLPAFTEGKTYRITYITNLTSDAHEVTGPDGATFTLDPMQAGFWMYDPVAATYSNRLVINNNNNRNLDAHIQFIFRHFSAAEESQRQTIYVDNLLATTFAKPDPRWVGNGSDALWTNPANWLQNEAPDPGTDLIFAGNQNLTPDNNFPVDTFFSGIFFDSTDSSFTLTGNRLELVASLVNNTVLDQTLALPVRIDSPLTASNTAATTTLTVSSAITGTGSITKKGAGLVALSGNNDFSGNVNVDQAGLTISGDQSACTASWIVRGYGASGTLNNTAASTLTFAPGSQIVVPSGKAVQAGHTSAVNGTQLQTIVSSATVTNDGTLYLGRSGRLTLNGGAWTQNGTSTLATQGGGTAILTVNTGASFTHANAQDLILRTSLSVNAITRINLSGGTLTTGAKIHNTNTDLVENCYSAITLTNGGTLRLAANLDDLFTTAGAGIRFFVNAGGGIIDTNGFNSTLNVPVEGSGGLTKTGAGSFVTTGPNPTSAVRFSKWRFSTL
jgi:autotransporter-associated beta strand protein